MQGYMDKVTKSLKLLGVGVVLFASIVLPSAGRNVGNAYDTCFPASMREGIRESLWEGPHGLLSFSQDNGLEPPMIHSKWYVDGLCGGDDGRLEAELWAREFGRAVAQMLDEYGRSWKTILRQEERVGAVEDLLDLADWFFQKPGYGNGLLFFRLQDLALAQICHLLCDMSIPVGTVAALMDRMVGHPDSVELGAKVLREECPEAGFPLIDWQEEESIRWNPVERGCRADVTVAPLETCWNKHREVICRWRENHGLPHMATYQFAGESFRQSLPRKLQFFVDDEHPAHGANVGTLVDWDRKFHRTFMLGANTPHLPAVQYLLLFREKAGKIPDSPPVDWDIPLPSGVCRSYDDPLEAAFDAAWAPFRIRFGNAQASYWIIRQIREGTFPDGGWL